jgi:hypothetical protein
MCDVIERSNKERYLDEPLYMCNMCDIVGPLIVHHGLNIYVGSACFLRLVYVIVSPQAVPCVGVWRATYLGVRTPDWSIKAEWWPLYMR